MHCRSVTHIRNHHVGKEVTTASLKKPGSTNNTLKHKMTKSTTPKKLSTQIKQRQQKKHKPVRRSSHTPSTTSRPSYL
jgi:hypothetical protein